LLLVGYFLRQLTLCWWSAANSYTCAVAPLHLYCTYFPVQCYSKSVARNASFGGRLFKGSATHTYLIMKLLKCVDDIYSTGCSPPHLRAHSVLCSLLVYIIGSNIFFNMRQNFIWKYNSSWVKRSYFIFTRKKDIITSQRFCKNSCLFTTITQTFNTSVLDYLSPQHSQIPCLRDRDAVRPSVFVSHTEHYTNFETRKHIFTKVWRKVMSFHNAQFQ
jgi:hypothetical protein